MMATINGATVFGTPDEIAELLKKLEIKVEGKST